MFIVVLIIFVLTDLPHPLQAATAMADKDREITELNDRVSKLQAIATASKATEQQVGLERRGGMSNLPLISPPTSFRLTWPSGSTSWSWSWRRPSSSWWSATLRSMYDIGAG